MNDWVVLNSSPWRSQFDRARTTAWGGGSRLGSLARQNEAPTGPLDAQKCAETDGNPPIFEHHPCGRGPTSAVPRAHPPPRCCWGASPAATHEPLVLFFSPADPFFPHRPLRASSCARFTPFHAVPPPHLCGPVAGGWSTRARERGLRARGSRRRGERGDGLQRRALG